MQSWDDSHGREALQDARTGDEQAARRLVNQYGASMIRTAWRVLGSYGGSDAEDVVQDAWVAAWTTDAVPQGDPGAWLRSVTARKALDRLRKTARLGEQPLEDVSQTVRIDDRLLNVLTLRKGLATLKPTDRATLVLIDLEGFTVAEAAKILGVSRIAMKFRAQRARKRLAARVLEVDDDSQGS